MYEGENKTDRFGSGNRSVATEWLTHGSVTDMIRSEITRGTMSDSIRQSDHTVPVVCDHPDFCPTPTCRSRPVLWWKLLHSVTVTKRAGPSTSY